MPKRKHAPRNISLAQRLAYSAAAADSGCILWTGCLDHRGYGILTYRNEKMFAHRAAWSVENGPIPDGALICHRCDTPACINAKHLFPGTAADNNADRDAKGRLAPQKGEANGRAKITDEIVRAIRSDPRPATQVERYYGVSNVMISKIRRRAAWAHVPD